MAPANDSNLVLTPKHKPDILSLELGAVQDAVVAAVARKLGNDPAEEKQFFATARQFKKSKTTASAFVDYSRRVLGPEAANEVLQKMLQLLAEYPDRQRELQQVLAQHMSSAKQVDRFDKARQEASERQSEQPRAPDREDTARDEELARNLQQQYNHQSEVPNSQPASRPMVVNSIPTVVGKAVGKPAVANGTAGLSMRCQNCSHVFSTGVTRQGTGGLFACPKCGCKNIMQPEKALAEGKGSRGCVDCVLM